MFNRTNKFSLVEAIATLRSIISSTNPSVSQYWETEFKVALDKKITDGHMVADPLAYFLVPLLGSRGRAMTDAQKREFPTDTPHGFPLRQFQWVVLKGLTGRNADKALRAVTKATPEALNVGLYGSHARKSTETYGDAEMRRLGNRILGVDDRQAEQFVGAINEERYKDASSLADRIAAARKLKAELESLPTLPAKPATKPQEAKPQETKPQETKPQEAKPLATKPARKRGLGKKA